MKVQNKDNKGNPYHSDSNGQFTSADGGGVKSEEKENQEILDKPLDNTKILSYTDSNKSGIGGLSFITKKGESNLREDKLRALLEDKEEKLETKPRKEREKVDIKWGRIPHEYRVKIEETLNGLLDDYNVGLGDLADGKYRLNVFYNGHFSRRFGHCQWGCKETSKDSRWYNFVFDIMLSSDYKDEAYSNSRHRSAYRRRGSKLINIENPGLATVSHEYAHHVANVYKIKTSRNRQQVENFMRSFKDRNGMPNERYSVAIRDDDGYYAYDLVIEQNPLEDKIYDRLAKEYGLNEYEMESRVGQEYGTYATKKRAEFFAEAFANMRHLKDEDKTDFMRSFERIFNEEFNSVFGG